MSNILNVATQAQAILFSNFLVPQLKDGHWAGARPTGHADDWKATEVHVNDNKVGRDGDFKFVNYDLLNKDFVDAIMPKAQKTLKSRTGQEFTPTQVRKELKTLMFTMRTPVGQPLATSHQGMMDKPGRPSIDVLAAKGLIKDAVAKVKKTAAAAKTKAPAKAANKNTRKPRKAA